MTQQFKPGVQEPQGQTPLREFKAKLKQYLPEERVAGGEDGGGGGGRKYMVINFNFTDVEVIEATEPYPFPIAVITIGYADPTKSRGATRWEAFAKSLRRLSPNNADIDVLVGKSQTWKMAPTKLRRPLQDEEGNPRLDGTGSPVWGDVDSEAWTVIAIDGIGTAEEADTDFDTYLIELADGKNEQEFYEGALTDSKVTVRSEIVTSITERKLLEALLTGGRLTRDAEGVLHKAN